ncbi:MAG: LptF/LptG family permease [Cyanophyceae cyanobacterium]
MTAGRSHWSIKLTGLSLLDRYIAGELILPFLFGMGIFTSLIVAIGSGFDLVRKVTESGLLLSLALRVLLLKIPGFIVWAFPMAILLATLMTYSRLSSDSELVALRSIGISTYRIILPGIFLSLLVTGMTFIVNDVIAPAANYEATIALEKALDRVKPTFQENNIIFKEYKEVETDGQERTVLARLFYAEEFDGQEMRHLTILDRSQAEISQIITAQSATWNVAANTWDFFDGVVYIVAPDGSYQNIVRFDRQQLSLPRAPLDVAQRKRDYNEMNFVQAQEYLKILELSDDDQKIRKLKVRIQEKIAFPFICLVFGFIGAVVGLRPQNTGRATSFGICVGLIFAYYLLIFLCSSLGVWGVLSPVMAAWLPNLLGVGAASVLLVRSSQ